MFNKIALAASAAVLFSGTAMAADAIVYNEPAPVAVANTFSWEGAYAGVNAGYGFGKMKEDGVSVKPRGFVGGVQAGYNWQFDQIVAGIEADFQGTSMKKSVTFYDETGAYEGDVKAKIQWFGTVRGRLGADIAERTMLYGTAGLAYGKVKIEGNDVDFGRDSASKTRAGWTAGAGIEHAFTDNVTLKTEYLYTDLGKVKFRDEADVSKVKTNFHTVRVGVNYKF
ncbi:outer membrane protein [Pseudochrobactrum asaccharolyticum]|jgi:outer membrane immunogenic protein|uniref:Outer membrane immunogenic protein n=1 Tax=Pseudochrobactrum asaccharolyticum TaxID=354351 RepID=A0A366EA45_9HYPH|nr:outer membrane protein [Pseudochrobactrum asaccharolyticum]RBO99187.1 outer membrane immunogenic protein [Pseudochrobactrum asaccharolyticum]